MARYRLLAGKHAQKEENPETKHKEVKIYKRGDVFESKHDLLKFNAGPGAMKFEKVEESENQPRRARTESPPPPPPHTVVETPAGKAPRNQQEFVAALEKMNEKDLRALAAEEEIDLKGAKTKDDIVKAIRSATTSG
jgi:hypothetical protein